MKRGRKEEWVLISMMKIFKLKYIRLIKSGHINIIMKIIKCSEKEIVLNGFSLKATLPLQNPNSNLAVLFEFQYSDTIPITIQPIKGIIFQNERKNVNIRIQPHYRDQVLQGGFEGHIVYLKASMKSQYNKKILEKIHLKEWNKVKNTTQLLSFPIKISTQLWNAISSIKSFSPSLLHESERQTHMKYEEKSNHSSEKKLNKKLNRELDFIFYKKEQEKQKSREQEEFIKKNNSFKSKVFIGEREKPVEKSVQKSMERLMEKSMERSERKGKKNVENKSQRSIQILLLALLSGFFLSLGANFGQLF